LAPAITNYSKAGSKEKLPLIFMLEQDPDDRELTEMISKEAGFEINFRFFSEQATFFHELSVSKPLPHIIILSYNSVGADLVALLGSLKSDKRFIRIPVIVLGESITEHALQEAYQHGASSYIVKTSTNSDTIHKISTFLNYWLNVVELPSGR
jgi:DNA-binding NarL/FixJ family response regulator